LVTSQARILVLEKLRGVGTDEKVNGPVEEHLRPVEVVAQLVEVDPLPDKSAQKTTEPHTQDIDQGAFGPQVNELAKGTVAERSGAFAPEIRYEVQGRNPSFLLGGLGQGWDAFAPYFQIGTVAHSVDSGAPPDAQKLVYEDAFAGLFRHVQIPHQGRRLDTGGPDWV